jgi:phosphoserine phosphatase
MALSVIARASPMRMPRDANAGVPLDLVVQAPAIVREDVAMLAALTDADDVEPLAHAATEAYRFHNVRQHDGVAAACAASGYDCALVPRSRRRERVRVVAMDMDSTLITIECVDELAALQDIERQVAPITESAMRGEIDFAESLRRRVALLAGTPITALERVFSERLALSPGAQAMLAGFRAVGARTLLVSGGFTFFTDRLQAQLDLDCTLANVLEIADGKLTGRVVGDIVDGRSKAQAFLRCADKNRGDDGLAVAIGDGANDLPMLNAADVSVAYHAKPAVRAQAMHAIDHCGLDAVLNLFV